jgi:glycosyltransferase involved in cell wall biosynthesis
LEISSSKGKPQILKISIITACYNNEQTIEDTLKSVQSQSYSNVEHIIIDGGSSDSTLEIIKEYPHISIVVSEPDQGIYDALNKGLALATGDVLGFLHSDDYFSDTEVLATINTAFETNSSLDCTFGDIRFIKENGDTLRYYSSKKWRPTQFRFGLMPAHTSFFAKKKIYDQHQFDLQFRIAGDFEQLIRIIYINKASYKYLPLVTTCMRPGGASTDGFKSNLTINKEILTACRLHGIRTNYLMIYSKYFKKIFEFIAKK